MALGRAKDVDAGLTIDAIVMAAAALADATVVTGDPEDGGLDDPSRCLIDPPIARRPWRQRSAQRRAGDCPTPAQ